MSGRDALTDLLRRHDRPVTPNADFADRLEARLLAELGPVADTRVALRAKPVAGRSGRSQSRERGWVEAEPSRQHRIGLDVEPREPVKGSPTPTVGFDYLV